MLLLDKNTSDFSSKLWSIKNDTSAAIILVGTEMVQEDYQYFFNAQNKIVTIDGWSKDLPLTAVVINNEDIVESAVDYLVQNGHRTIGYIRGGGRLQNFCEREIGYRKGLTKNGLSHDPDHTFSVAYKLEDICQQARDYLQKHRGKLPTAFIAENDHIAIGVMRAIQQSGYRIPDDISIIGIDDNEYSKIETPPLTTFQIHMQELGEIAVKVLLDEDRHLPRIKIQVRADFIERQSVKKL